VRYVFWLSLVGILYTYIGYPILIWLLSKLFPHRWITGQITPTVSIVLAVHNGASLLPRKISHLLSLNYPKIPEIILVSDGSTDGTNELLAQQHHPRIKTIILPEHAGKAVAVNAGVELATSEIILFVDIRPEIADGAIQKLVSNFADPKVGCVAGELVLKQEKHDAATASIGGHYWLYEQWIRSCECLFDSPSGVYGGFYAIRRALAVPQPPGTILDDMFQPLSIIRQGYRSVLDPRARVNDTWPEQVEGEFNRKVRTLAGNFQLFQLAPWALMPGNRVWFQFISHKVMRLVVPYLLIALLVSSIALAFQSRSFAFFAAAQILGWFMAVIGLKSKIPGLHRLASPASALLVLNAAAVVGLYRFLMTRGPLWKIWNSGPIPSAEFDS